MQAITPVDVYVENGRFDGPKPSKDTKTSSQKVRQTPRIRTRVVSNVKKNKSKPILSSSSRIPKQVVIPKVVVPVRSRSSSSNKEPWVPAPGRSTKGQKVSFLNPKSRLEINPVTEFIVDDENSWNSEHAKHNTTADSQTNTLSTEEKEKLMAEIQIYEKRIQGVIDGIGMLKELLNKQANPQQTDQLRSDIDSSLNELERFQQSYVQHLSQPTSKLSRSRSLSPTRNNDRSSSVDHKRRIRSVTPKVSFHDDLIVEKRKPRSTTPVRGPIHLNPDREQLLVTLADSEVDITQIEKKLSLVATIIKKLRFDDQPVSFEVEQLYQHRNELLHLIEQFQRSNTKLQQFLRHQFHLEAEHGIIYDQYDTLKTHIYELEHENEHIRRLLLDRENDNIALQAELERSKTHSIGFDTMKTSLEQNRAHLQRELYSKEGEIHRLQCALRALERDLQRSRCHCEHVHRTMKQKSISSCPSPSHSSAKSKAMTIDRLQAELADRDNLIDDLKIQLDNNDDVEKVDLKTENMCLKAKLEQTEQLLNECRAQLHTQTLQTSATNSKNHLSEVELEKVRSRLLKRIEELDPLPELLKQAEAEKEKLQKDIDELRKRLPLQSNFLTQSPLSDQSKHNRCSPTDDIRALQRRVASLEEENAKLLKMLNTKEEELRNAQLRLSTPRPYEPISNNKPTDIRRPDYKIRDDIYNSTNNSLPKNNHDLEQQTARLRLEHAQLKRERDELERNFKTQMNELRQKLDQSNSANRTMQNYINSLKTTYATLFNDTLPASVARYTTS